MNNNLIILVFLSLTFCLSCSGQKTKDLNVEELELKANLFIERLSAMINEESPERIKSELIVSKQDLRHFLDTEWKRKYNYFARKSMQDRFEPSVEKGWKEIQREDGYILIGPIVKNKDVVTEEKIINPTFKNCVFSKTSVNISDTYDRNKGEISMLRLININTLVTTDTYPVYRYNYNFPCLMAMDGDLKIVGFVTGNLISTDDKKN